MRSSRVVLAGALLLALLPARARAQTVVGPFLGYHTDLDLGVGAFVGIPVPSLDENLAIKPDFGYFFPGGADISGVDFSYWEVNVDGIYQFPVDNESIAPFAMAGINVGHWSFDEDVTGLDLGFGGTEVGLNLGGGVTFLEMGTILPSVGAKLELNGGDGLVLFGAVGFPVGGEPGGM